MNTDALSQVTFEAFKEGFVAVLSQAIDALSSSEDEETEENTGKNMNTKNTSYYIIIVTYIILNVLHIQ